MAAEKQREHQELTSHSIQKSRMIWIRPIWRIPFVFFFFSGVQERDIRCVLTNDNSIVSDEACDLLAKPPSSRECNMEACAPMYVIKINLIYFLTS